MRGSCGDSRSGSFGRMAHLVGAHEEFAWLMGSLLGFFFFPDERKPRNANGGFPANRFLNWLYLSHFTAHDVTVVAGLEMLHLMPITQSLTKLSQSWGVHLETPILN